MKYSYQKGLIVPFAQRFYKQLTIAVAALFIATFAATTLSVGAASVPLNGCTFLQTGSKWKLVANCTSTAQINVPAGTRLDGNNKTIRASFPKTSNDNNAALGVIGADNVKIKDLTIDGAGGSAFPLGLHGINAYNSLNLEIKDVTVKNMTYFGIVVNGSEVTVKDISTSGNGWGGMNVDQGSGVTMPSILTVKGRSRHTDMAHIYVDNMNKQVQVNDVRNQYSFMHPNVGGTHPNDRLYTLKPVVNNHHDDDDHDD